MSEKEEVETDDPTSGIVTTMVIFCSVAFVVFSILYLICWYRAAKEKKKQRAAAATTETSPTEHTSADIPTTTDEEETPPAAEQEEDGDGTVSRPRRPPRRQYTQEWSPTSERQPGQPVYDKYLVGGTISLMILLWIGANIVLIMSLTEQSNFNDASIDDFQSLGEESCRILENSTTYYYYDEKLNALNTLCIEIWVYTVEVNNNIIIANNNEQQTTTTTYFVSAPVTLGSCYSSCENCLLSNKLHGSNYYAGLDPLRKGRIITNTTYVECWEPTIPTQDLSDYYDCGYQRTVNSTCYLLEDASIELDEHQNSSQTGLIAAYICFIGGFILLLLVIYFKYKNKKVYEEEMQQQQEEEERGETEVEEEEEDVSSVMSSSTNNNKNNNREEKDEEGINDDNDYDESQIESSPNNNNDVSSTNEESR